MCSHALVTVKVEDEPDDLRRCRVDLEVIQHTVFLSDTAVVYAFVAKRDRAAAPDSLCGDLLLTRFHAHGCLFAFAHCLPESNVVDQLVGMRFQPHLPFLGAPNLDPMFDQPLCYKRCFIVASSQTVKHKDQQNIEALFQRRLFQLGDLIAFCGGYLETGYAFFTQFINDLPIAHSLSELMAFQALQGNVVFVNLTGCGYSVQTDNSFHDASSF